MGIKFYNKEKLERARILAGLGASDEKILEKYILLGGKYEELGDEKPVKAKPRKKK